VDSSVSRLESLVHQLEAARERAELENALAALAVDDCI